MASENLAYYLEDTSRLKELPLERLEDWLKEYPYAQPVRFLHAKKCLMEGMSEDSDVIKTAYMYAPNQRALKNFLSEKQYFIEEETKKKKKAKGSKKAAIAAAAGTTAVAGAAIVTPTPTDELAPAAPSESDTSTLSSDHTPSEQKKKKKKGSKKKRRAVIIDSSMVQDREVRPEYAHGHLTSYTQWLMSLESSEIFDKKKKKKKKKKKSLKKKAKKALLKKQAKESIEPNEEIISESLAALLAEQGHHKKATKMYKKLSLIFPQKSDYFAAQIEALNP